MPLSERLAAWWGNRHRIAADLHPEDSVAIDALEHHAEAVDERVELQRVRAETVMRRHRQGPLHGHG